MKKFRMTLFLFFISLPFSLWSSQRVLVEYFHNAGCADCRKISNLFFPALQQDMGNQFKLVSLELSEERNFLHLLRHLDQAKDNSNEKMYVVVNERIVIGGANAIERQLPAIIRNEYTHPAKQLNVSRGISKNMEKRFTLPMVLVAGFLDGINPCVFATLVFFISILSIGTAEKKQILQVGTVYIAGCFLTYFTIGFGLYQVLSWAVTTSLLRLVLNGTVLIVLAAFAIISFADAIRFKRLGAPGVILQMPQYLKNFVHKLMRNSRKQLFVLSGVFLLSIFVTLAESVCTGQVYAPTLLYLANSSGTLNQWWGYLLLYNLMFIIPLIAVFAFAVWSIRLQLLLKLSRHDVVIAKILMGFFFLILAGLLGYFEFFHES